MKCYKCKRELTVNECIEGLKAYNWFYDLFNKIKSKETPMFIQKDDTELLTTIKDDVSFCYIRENSEKKDGVGHAIICLQCVNKQAQSYEMLPD